MAAQPRLVNKQFNSPINLYSKQNVQEVLERDTQILSNGAVGINFYNPGVGKQGNLANSAVLRMLEEEENRQRNGHPPSNDYISRPLREHITWPPPEYERRQGVNRATFKDVVTPGAKRVAWPPPRDGEDGEIEQPAVQSQGGPQISSQTSPAGLQNNHVVQPAPRPVTRSPLKPLDISSASPNHPNYLQSPVSPLLNQSPVGFRPQTPSKPWAPVHSPALSHSPVPQPYQQAAPQYQPVLQQYQPAPPQQQYQPVAPQQQQYQPVPQQQQQYQPPNNYYIPAYQQNPQEYQPVSSQQYQPHYQPPLQQYQAPSHQQQYQPPPQPQYQAPPQQQQQYQPPPQPQYQAPPQQQYQPPPQPQYQAPPQQQHQPSPQPQYQAPPPQQHQPSPSQQQYQGLPPQYQPAPTSFTTHPPAPNQQQVAPAQVAQPVHLKPQPVKSVEPPPSTITLRPQAPVSQAAPPVVTSQPATANFKGGKNLRGDMKWPPEEVKSKMEEENQQRIELARGPACRPRRVRKDYTGFFAQHALNSTYPGYKIPPGTQFYRT